MSYEIVNPNSDMALMQASGIGAYQNVGDWTFELFPYDYSFEAPADSVPIQPPVLKGMGCGCGCGGGCSKNQGLGQGLFNTGLFTNANPSTWGWGEWSAVAAGLYLAGSLISDIGRGARAAGRVGKRAGRKARRAATSTAGLTIGSALSVLAVAGIGYMAYSYVAGQQPAVTQ